MIVGIEQTTDLRHPETLIKVFRAEAPARRWLTAPGVGGYAWRGAADAALPLQQQNFHHRFRYAYRMPHGWRLHERDVREQYRRQGWRDWNEAKAAVIRRAAVSELARA
jgi:hypothetical protein